MAKTKYCVMLSTKLYIIRTTYPPLTTKHTRQYRQ